MANAKFLDLTGLKHFWESVRDTNGANIKLTGYTKEGNIGIVAETDTIVQAIAKLENMISDSTGPDAIVTSFGGAKGEIDIDTTQATKGKVKFTMSGQKLTGTVVGLKSAAYTDSTAYAAASHNHTISQISDLNDGWDALLKAAPDVVDSADLAAKADKTEALKETMVIFSATEKDITVNMTNTPIEGDSKFLSSTIPAANGANCGVISENKVKELASSLVAELDGSLVFKGTVKPGSTGGTTGDIDFTTLKNYKIGHTYLVAVAGTFAGQACEVGDMLVCKADYSDSLKNSDWAVIQTNINGAVTSAATLTDGQLVLGSGGKAVKTLAVGTNGYVLTSDGSKPVWKELPKANGGIYGVISSNAIAKVTNGQITEVTAASTAREADHVTNALTIKSLAAGGTLDSGVAYNGSAAVGIDAITFSEIDGIFAVSES